MICLVRADDPDHAVARVRRNLDRYALRTDGLGRVTGLPGDLDRPWLGLSPDAVEELAARVHGICHNGGRVNFRLPYQRLRASNVDGTAAVLGLAAIAGAVPVHLVSTLGVYLGKAYRDRVVTEFDPPDDPAELSGGYNQSKWVGDALARLARARGLPVSVHRPARIGANSRTGRANPDDYLHRLMLSCVQLGLVPALPHDEDLYPVDRLAAAIAHLAVQDATRHHVGERTASADYHYFSRTMISYPELAAALVERGCAVELVPWQRWRAAANDRVGAGHPLALADLLDVLPDDVPDLRRPRFDCAATRSALAVAGMHEPPAAETLARHVDALLDPMVTREEADS